MNKDSQLKLAKDIPYYKYLGIEIVEVNEGYAKLRLDFKEHLTHPFGALHGGAIASLADSAGINAVLTVLDQSQRVVTVEMKINYLLPAKDAAVYAEGKVIQKGKRVAVSDIDVKGSDGRLVAKAIATYAIF